MRATIKYVMKNVHMGLGHAGLAEHFKDATKTKITDLDAGDLVMCINKKGDKIKVIGSKGWVVGYLKTPTGQPLMQQAIKFLPRTFGGGDFNYDDACRMALQERFSRA